MMNRGVSEDESDRRSLRVLGELWENGRKRNSTTRWLMAMKAYFQINHDFYDKEEKMIVVFLSKLTNGRAGTFTKGWYLRLNNLDLPDSEKEFDELCSSFEEAFSLKDIKYQA